MKNVICVPFKGTVFFFISRDMFVFCELLGKTSEWIKKLFFFSGTVCFRPLQSSEWAMCELLLRKKNTIFSSFFGKKQRKKMKFDKKCYFLPFLTFFWRLTVSQLSEWLANFSWEKKKQLFFSKTRKKKKTKIAQSEWVSTPQSFPGKKKRYLWIEAMKI